MFDIRWTLEAFGQMQRIIAGSPQLKAEFAFRLQEVAASLGSGAADVGESRYGPLRVAFFGGLSVFFTVHDRLPMATITSVSFRAPGAS